MQNPFFAASLLVSATLIASSGAAAAGTITLPSGSVTVPSTEGGTTVSLSGTYSATDRVTFSVSGIVYLQNTVPDSPDTGIGEYGVNAAGVVVVAGAFPGESPGTTYVIPADNTYAGYVNGALLVSLNGGPATAIFSADAATGLGDSSPPTTLVFSGLASALFGNFGTVTNPSITFVVADDLYSDNTGSFTVSSVVPEPSAWALTLIGFAGLGLVRFRALRTSLAVATLRGRVAG